LRVYIDSTTDLKSLIGCYTCSQKIGEFEFAAGPIYHCMQNGKLLLLENF